MKNSSCEPCSSLWRLFPNALSRAAIPGLGLALLCGQTVLGALRVTHLRCEYLSDPLGLGTPQPRLSWVIESKERVQLQTAYRVLVASSEKLLHDDRADLWDSARVASDRSIQVPYAGQQLSSRQRCYWKVRVWDLQGKASSWSAPATFEMGLLYPQDWRAQWIGFEQRWPGQEHWAEAQWIWASTPGQGAAASREVSLTNLSPVAHFRRVVEVPGDRRLRRALMRLTADEYFEFFVNGEPAGHNSGKPYSSKIIQEYEVQDRLRAGGNVIAVLATNREGAGGLLGQLVMEFERGEPLAVQTDRSWLASATAAPGWESAGLPGSDAATGQGSREVNWTPAIELAKVGGLPWQPANYPPMLPCPYLRKDVFLPDSVQRARLYVSALGIYEFFINGQRVGRDLFNPGWTDYTKRVQYHTYDVTKLVRRGENALGIILGDGWYSGFVGLGGRCRYGDLPLCLAQLEVELKDGSRQTLATDASWKAAIGPIRQSDMLMGETYDARLELGEWTRPKFDDALWTRVTSRQVTTPLVAAVDPPVRATQELKPIALTEPKRGTYVFDLGQNMVGWARLRVKGRAGTRVTLRFAEMLDTDGTLYLENLREARVTDHYVLRGGGEEVWEPRFTFHGFRYVELTGYPGKPDQDAITGVVLQSDLSQTGWFECSSPDLNQLQKNIVWGQRGNFLSIPTDCPQRDERLGWTGDAQIFAGTASFNLQVAPFFTKWCVDVEDAQRGDGAFTDVAPFVAATNGTAAWGDAGVICPWTIYQRYGDERILERHYAAGAHWIEYCRTHSTDLLRPAFGYGDWLSIEADTPKDLLATAYFAHSTRLMAKMAAVLGKSTDAAQYEELFLRIKGAFNAAYVSPEGRLKGDTQTAYVLALQFELLPADKRAAAARYLLEDIRNRRWHLSTGFVGSRDLLPVLTRAGYIDAAYLLVNTDTFPSWLYSIRQGATTIWERWDGWTRERGFQTPSMNSFNHYSFGAVGDWMYANIGGLSFDPALPAFQHIVIRPRPGGGVKYARTAYESMHGRIATDWRIDKGRFTLKLHLPANTAATVYLPAADAGTVLEGGKPVERARGLKFLRLEEGSAVFAVSSGEYELSHPW